jgi:hypothetical protein
VVFQLFILRLTFRALDPVRFAPGAAANAFRGAFGHTFRRQVCVPECPGAATCPERARCPYARLFEPASHNGPSGLLDPPRPFVIRAAALDGKSYPPGETFSIHVHTFDLHEPAAPHFTAAFAELAREGIGTGRGRVELAGAAEPESLSLPLLGTSGPDNARLTLRFVTPTELKSAGRSLRDAPFDVVFARTRDRIATLSALYGSGPLDLDFRGMGERASRVRTVRSSLEWRSNRRKSGRTQAVHPLSGFTGEVRYEGPVGEFLPLLRAAYWTGIGRHTVWGNGVVEVVGTEPRPSGKL